MNELRRQTIRLTVQYSMIFFAFVWFLSGGVYLWVNSSLGEGYVKRVNQALTRQHGKRIDVSDTAAGIAADVTLDKLRNILIAANALALIGVPALAYTVSKRSLSSLIESQATQARFVAHASHELRTPLAIMSGELELALKKPRRAHDYHTTIIATYAETRRMITLVHELLLLARVQNNANKLVVEPLHPATLVRAALDDAVPLANEKSLHFQFVDELPPATIIMGERGLLQLALKNIIDNAVKFAFNDSTITVRLSAKNHHCSITVMDSGEPIKKTDIIHMFDQFYQADTSHSSRGVGLGLAITRQIVMLHHGKITAESQGNSVTITALLPLATR